MAFLAVIRNASAAAALRVQRRARSNPPATRKDEIFLSRRRPEDPGGATAHRCR
jgi:hypothetical protein